MLSFACFSTIVPNVMVNCFQWRIAGIGITDWCQEIHGAGYGSHQQKTIQNGQDARGLTV